MEIEMLGTCTPEFLAYCKAHRREHDESFLDNESLSGFVPDADNPTVVLRNDMGTIAGVASLMVGNSYKKNKRGRARVLHAQYPSVQAYAALLNAVTAELIDIENIYLFLPEERGDVGNILQQLGFTIERYAWILRRGSSVPLTGPIFPKGYRVERLRSNKDEQAWCDISNKAFAVFSWHTDLLPEMVEASAESHEKLGGGLYMLWDNGTPIGILQVEAFSDENKAEIGPIAILPEYQGTGLGRNLLRFGLEAAYAAGFETVELSVNGENSKAASLYLSEGFEKDTLMLCYNKYIGN